ncbi:MAG TPA: YdcF family protein, partial [Vicinamibacteria bacterium]|nr:YdcF family protein [Vicinamibacteria bacterium]
MSIDSFARVVWDFHHLHHPLAPAECILVLGSHDTRVAARGAEVYLAGWAPLLLFSGNLGALTSGVWDRPEAEIFADVAAEMGVPRERMLIEPRSTNTGENVDFSRALLAERGLRPTRAIAVQKPYMERRTYATFKQRWPELDVIVTSPQVSFDDYPNDAISRDDVIHIMVG